MPELFFQDYPGPSDAVPLVVLHGLFGSSTNWRGVGRRLAAGRRVIAMDMRNHGRSFNDEAMSYPLMARDVLDTLDGQGIGRADLLGHSMGGKAAMVCALEHPERVGRLIVVDIAPVAYTHTQLPLVESMMALDLASVGSRKQADEALAASVADTAVRQFLLQSLERGEEGYRWRLNLPALKRAMGYLVGFPDLDGRTCEGPTLFLYGADSHYFEDSYRPRIERYFPNAEYRAIAGAGHWVHVDQPAALIEAVEGFLS
ncbi:MAG: alpha/beta fold hydrolase [Arenicellales bacterium]